MPEPLTKLERRILDYLVDYLRRNTYQPSIREIGRRFGIKSTKTVSEHLQSLADKGWIERDPSRSRGVRLLGLNLQPQTVSVPHYGTTAEFGEGPAPRDTYEFDRRLVDGHAVFFLTMVGDEMEMAGVRDGDLLLVEPVSDDELADGDIVVARVAGEGVVRRYSRRGGAAVLEPADPTFPAIPIGQRVDAAVAGRVTGVFRRLHVPQAATATAAGEPESTGALS